MSFPWLYHILLLIYPNLSYNVNFDQKMMASMIQAIQASKSSESSLASLRNLRTFLLLIEINMLGTNLETGSHIYPWLWSNQCRWFLTPKLYVQNHQIHQKKRFFKSGCWYNDDTHPPRWGQTWLSCCGKISQVKLGYSSFWTSPNFFAYPCTMCIRAEKMRMSIHELSRAPLDGHGDVSRYQRIVALEPNQRPSESEQ